MSEVTLYHANCLEEMNKIEYKSVDLILCDLPYGKSSDKTRAKWDSNIDLEKLKIQYLRILKDNGTIILFGNEPFSSEVRLCFKSLYKYDYKWIKSKTTGFANCNYRPMNKYEDIMIFSKLNASVGGSENSMLYNPQGLISVNIEKKNRKNRQGIVSKDTNNIGKNNSFESENTYVQKYTNYPCNILYFDNPKQYLHPTQKPTDLLEFLIKTYTNENYTVLDNCYNVL